MKTTMTSKPARREAFSAALYDSTDLKTGLTFDENAFTKAMYCALEARYYEKRAAAEAEAPEAVEAVARAEADRAEADRRFDEVGARLADLNEAVAANKTALDKLRGKLAAEARRARRCRRAADEARAAVDGHILESAADRAEAEAAEAEAAEAKTREFFNGARRLALEVIADRDEARNDRRAAIIARNEARRAEAEARARLEARLASSPEYAEAAARFAVVLMKLSAARMNSVIRRAYDPLAFAAVEAEAGSKTEKAAHDSACNAVILSMKNEAPRAHV